MTNKEKLLEFINTLPDDLEWFDGDSSGHYGEIDIRIFKEPQDEEFYSWYFCGM